MESNSWIFDDEAYNADVGASCYPILLKHALPPKAARRRKQVGAEELGYVVAASKLFLGLQHGLVLLIF